MGTGAHRRLLPPERDGRPRSGDRRGDDVEADLSVGGARRTSRAGAISTGPSGTIESDRKRRARACASVRTSPPRYSNLAGALYGLGRFEEARAVYRAGDDSRHRRSRVSRLPLADRVPHRRRGKGCASMSTGRKPARPGRAISSRVAALQGRWREAQAKTAQTAGFFDARGMAGLAARGR